MRKFLVITIALTGIALGGLGIYTLSEANKKFEQDVVQKVLAEQTKPAETKFKYFTDSNEDIYLVEFEGYIDLIYNKNVTKTAREISETEQFIISTNGGFFRENKAHAGLLIQYGVLMANIAPNDNQVTGVVILNKNSISFKNIKEINVNNYLHNKDNIVFQTGPIIVSDNNVNTTAIKKSVNGTGRYLRTLLGYTQSGKKFFAITTKNYDLETLAEEILKMQNLQGEIVNVINLDGGTSTYIYSNENKDFNIGTFKTLPIILGVK